MRRTGLTSVSRHEKLERSYGVTDRRQWHRPIIQCLEVISDIANGLSWHYRRPQRRRLILLST